MSQAEQSAPKRFQPNRKLSIVLYFYFTSLVFTVIYLLRSAEIVRCVSNRLMIPFWTESLLLTFGFAYSFYAMIVVLKGRDNSVFCFRTAIVFQLFLVALFVPYKYAHISLTLFYVFLFFYIGKNKAVLNFIPVNKRKTVSWGGCGGILLLIVIATIHFSSGVRMTRNKGETHVYRQISLQEGEFSDGHTAFTPCASWSTPNIKGAKILFEGKEDDEIVVCTDFKDCYSRTDFCGDIIDDCPNPMRLNDVTEVAFFDTTINGNTVYSSTFRYKEDTTTCFWTKAAIKDRKSNKCFMVFVTERGGCDCAKDVKSTIQSVRFNLK